MKLVRLLLFASGVLLLAGGYIMSQLVYAKMVNTQDPTVVLEYAKQIDVPIVSLLAAIVVIGCAVSAVFASDQEGEPD